VTKVTSSIDIAAAPQDVWNVVMDPKRLGEWVTIHRGLGEHGRDHMEQTLCLRGVNFHVRWELAECEEPHRAVWEGRGPARSKAHTAYRITASNGGSKFHYENEFKAPFGPLVVVASKALVGGVSEREANASLHRLKALLES
jgi:carbon monoxide dehydrogenase subunit G